VSRAYVERERESGQPAVQVGGAGDPNAGNRRRMKIKVQYLIGSRQYTGYRRSYLGARRLARKNRNAMPAKFFGPDGAELYDNGFALVYADGTGELALVGWTGRGG
jgi:hypothetical protein